MQQDIQIIRGTSNTFRVTVRDANGNPYALAKGESIIFGVKRKPTFEEYVVKKVVTECTNGTCIFEITPQDTVRLPTGKYFYDVGLQSGARYFNIIEPSVFVLSPNVTKWGDGA